MMLLALSFFGTANAAAGSSAILCQKLLQAPCNDQGWKQFPNTYNISQTECETYLDSLNIGAGDDADTSGNTFGCRIHYANLANATNRLPCRYAGITGGGVCGNIVDNACQSIVSSCTGVQGGEVYANVSECATALGGFVAIWGSKQGPAAADDNSLECRVYHALVGYNLNNHVGTENTTDPHCNHTKATGNVGWCANPVPTDAEHYCKTHELTCANSGYQQYKKWEDCIASFNSFPDGEVKADNVNNRGCRQYHIQAAAAGVAPGLVHCTHGGPSGGEQCGTLHAAWGSISNNSYCAGNANFSWVGRSVAGALANFASADYLTIVPPSNATYNTTNAATGDNVLCRIYHATVAAGGDVTHCGHPAIPSEACFDTAPVVAPICRMIWAGCGNSSNYTDVASCVAALAPIAQNRSGSPLDNNGSPNTDTLACRAFQAAQAVAAKKMSGPTAAACANVKPAAGPLCMGMVAPTPGPAKSDASTVLLSASLALPLLFL